MLKKLKNIFLGKNCNNFNGVKINSASKIQIGDTIVTGKEISIIDGVVTVDGKKVDLKKEPVINIEIITAENSRVENVEILNGNISITGRVDFVNSTSGDVTITGNVTGNVKTISGDVYCNDVFGNIQTVSGDVIEK